ncbi:MAG: DUF2971 domain-containing protein [Bacteroidales bacterium]|nr:DUF2971 domain-containing protein [Bacteroidales bacterium]
MNKIYHYTSLNTAIEFILPKMRLRTNGLKNMNDPKENQLWAFSSKNMDYPSIYPETFSEDRYIEHQFMFGNEIRENIQAICFVNNEDNRACFNAMMWAHYASNHRGVCLEIDADRFIEENKEVLINFKLEKVQYGKHEDVFIDYNRSISKEANILKIIESKYQCLFLQKSVNWEHEKEIRLLIIGKEHTYLTIENSLTGVYLGLFFPYEYRPSIDKLISTKKATIFDVSWEKNDFLRVERSMGDFRPLILKKFLNHPK